MEGPALSLSEGQITTVQALGMIAFIDEIVMLCITISILGILCVSRGWGKATFNLVKDIPP
ncbi:hypothetical protein J3A83DRAFT_4374601 [Scleroderma citrinum]